MKLKQWIWISRDEANNVSSFISTYLTLDGYEETKKQALIFNHIPEANDLKSLFQGIAGIKAANLRSTRDLFNCCQSILAALAERLQEGTLDKALLSTYITDTWHPLLDNMSKPGVHFTYFSNKEIQEEIKRNLDKPEL